MTGFLKIIDKRIYILIICYIISIPAFCEDFTKYKIVLCIYRENHTVCIYNTPNKDSVVARIKDNVRSSKLFGFNILEKQDSMIKVIAWNTVNNKIIKGWVKITETAINGRTRTENSIYELYDRPDYNSKKTVIKSYWDCYVMLNGKYKKVTCNINSLFNILDISEKWVKIKVIGKGKIYIKWLPREYQCMDITGECT
ncbi:hypothetical protein [Paludibacter jiangxiensis]|uniref:Uncharacterized protein n=1 Tax=Paludibacter jiangxiensis TaxID=681398 RepID=A0A170YLE5_9BACT|nr:hypothetical protein [Paludibacter jiangxiensis]GAT61892.1 hypothetical protein PJIAN_1479 [Paludibacter jiangxiensis]